MVRSGTKNQIGNGKIFLRTLYFKKWSAKENLKQRERGEKEKVRSNKEESKTNLSVANFKIVSQLRIAGLDMNELTKEEELKFKG